MYAHGAAAITASYSVFLAIDNQVHDGHVRCRHTELRQFLPGIVMTKEGPYQDRPPLCPFRLLPLLTCS